MTTMISPNDLKEIDNKQPQANDLLRGWQDAELGVEYQRDESDDWKMGWRLWNHEHGQKRSSHAWH